MLRIRPSVIAAFVTSCIVLYFLITGTTRQEIESTLVVGVDREVAHVDSFTAVDKDVKARNTDLIQVVYYETDDAKRNLEFFIQHALHDKADFLFVINGDATLDIPNRSNVRVVRKENSCYDLGSHGEILFEREDLNLRQIYKRFILLNTSVRGPFIPRWGQVMGTCWSDVLFAGLSDRVKLFGLTIYCHCPTSWLPEYNLTFEYFPAHVQSTVFAVDLIGLDIIRPQLACYEKQRDAIVFGETRMSQAIREAGYQVDALYSGRMKYGHKATADEFFEKCLDWNPQVPEQYDGMNLHPFDSLFSKSILVIANQDTVGPGFKTLETLTKYVDASNYSSYDYCVKAK